MFCRKTFALVVSAFFLLPNICAEVTLDFDGASPANGAEICNNTLSVHEVKGTKFRTSNFAGYSAGSGTFDVGGTSPVQYTHTFPSTEWWGQQTWRLETSKCLNKSYLAASVPAGQDATVVDPQLMIKTGGCSSLPIFNRASPTMCSQVDPASDPDFYKQDLCIVDVLGKNGGAGSGGFVDTWYGQTQVQAGIPTTSFTLSVTNVVWDPYTMGGPQYMMSMAAIQELFDVDMQFMIAVGGKETFLAMRQVPGAALYDAFRGTSAEGAYSPFEMEMWTFGRMVMTYPQFWGELGCVSSEADVTTAMSSACVSALGGWGGATGYYLNTPGGDWTQPNSPQMISAVIAGAMNYWWLHDALTLSTNVCFVESMIGAQDPRLALAALLPGYNLGINSGFESALNSGNLDALKNDPNGRNQFPMGNSNYRQGVFEVLDGMEGVNSQTTACGGTAEVYDEAISLTEVQRFFLGGNITPGTVAAQGDGGLLTHFTLNTAQRQALWDEVLCVFDKLKGRAPGVTGTQNISFRYDWLSVLRTAKRHLALERGYPIMSEFNQWVINHSAGGSCGSVVQDDIFPDFVVSEPLPGAVVGPNFDVKLVGSDNQEIDRVEWTLNPAWGVWNVGATGAGPDYSFVIDCSVVDYPLPNTDATLWLRVSDVCGNSTVQELPFRTNADASCAPPSSSSAVSSSSVPSSSSVTPSSSSVVPTVPSPVIVSAVLYDGNQDGKGDSLVVTLQEALGSRQADSVVWVFPNEGGRNTKSTLITFLDEKTFYIKGSSTDGPVTIGEGYVWFYTSVGGASLPAAESVVTEVIGPVPTGAFLVDRQGVPGDERLIVVFSEPLDRNVAANLTEPFLIGASGSEAVTPILTASVQGDGTIWEFTLSEGLVDSGMVLKARNSGGLKDLAANLPPANHRGVVVQMLGVKIDLASDGHAFYDMNADGTMDMIALQFPSGGVNEKLLSSFQTVQFTWIDSAGNLILLEPNSGALQPDPVDDSRALWSIPESFGNAPMTTSFDPAEYGTGFVFQIYYDFASGTVVLDDTTWLNMQDRMGPVIAEAKLLLSSRPERRPDTLLLDFSETIAVDAITETSLFEFMLKKEISPRTLRYGDRIRWEKENSRLPVYFTPDIAFKDRPYLGDSVRMIHSEDPGYIRDLKGNGAGFASRFRLIEGNVVTIITGNDLVKVDGSNPDEPVFEEPEFWPINSTLEEITGSSDGEGVLGAVIVPGLNLSRDLDANRISWRYNIEYYTNLGGFVASKSGVIRCRDEVFQDENGEGDCLVNGVKKIFIRWNSRAKNGRLVGSGAYVERVNFDGMSSLRTVGVLRE